MIPEQIRRQAAQVEEYERALLAREQAQTEGDEGSTEGDTKAPTAVQEQQDQQVQDSKPAPQPRVDDEEDKWRRRYESLRGKYDAEITPLHRQNRELQQKLMELEKTLEELSKRKPEPEPKPAGPLVTPQDVENFGSDLIDLIGRKATEVFHQYAGSVMEKIRELESENACLRETVSTVEQKQGLSQKQIFLQQLAVRVPDWEALNTDPDFLAWLTVVDPLSGLQRQVLLDAAAESFDVARVAALFNAYKKEAGIGMQPVPQPAPQVTQQDQKKSEVSAQVAPGKSKASSPAPASDQSRKIWRQAEVTRFYDDVRRGLYRGREAEQARIEAEIDLAVAEGRVR